MKYLDERITCNVEPPSNFEAQVYRYDVRCDGALIFVGNTYIDPDRIDGYIEVDITSIVRNSVWKPTFMERLSTNSPVKIINNVSYVGGIVKRFEVYIHMNDDIWSSNLVEVNMMYRYPLMKQELNNGLDYNTSSSGSLWVSLQGRYAESGKGLFRLPPRIPLKHSNNYALVFAGWASNNLRGTSKPLNILNMTMGDNKYVYIPNNNYCTIYPLDMLFEDVFNPVGDTGTIEFMGDYIAEIDFCPKRYYLMWQDRAGSFQSQPFDKVETYSETFDREYITNNYGYKQLSTITVNPKIKVQTGFIEDELYPYYESIFTSPYLLLFDTKEDKSYLVNVTGDYTEKTFKNQGRQFFNLQLDLDFAKTQNMIY